MNWDPMISALLCLGALGVAFGLGLALAARFFHVDEDPRVNEVHELLPGVDCGACGFPGCRGYAEAVVKGEAGPSECAPGGAQTAQAVAAYMGLEAEVKERTVAVLRCNGRNVADRFEMVGIEDCTAALLLHGGPKVCEYGCLGLGTCARVCPTNAIVMEDGFPRVIEEKCIACGKCVAACPKDLFALLPVTARVHVLCRSQAKGAAAKRACAVACIGCTKCLKVCPVDAPVIDKFLSTIDTSKCINCGKCIEECPTDSIRDFRDALRPLDQPAANTPEPAEVA